MLAKLLPCLVAAGALLGNAPAMAKETATPAPMEGIIALDNLAAGKIGDVKPAGSEEFRELFASWEALEQGGRVDKSGNILAAPQANVAVPSRMPVEEMRMSSSYGMRDHPVLRQRKQHNGVDLAAPRGTPVYATADGMVGVAKYWGSYGNYVQIEHGGELETRYGHLSAYTVQAGDMVSKGDLIGYVGSTGRSTGPHLHYEVRIDGEPVNPIPYMVAHAEDLAQGEGGRGGPE
tara:strand:- start:571 stop:1272 length:702 start_codon:yes stop_codon:yes gene_type:complete